MVRSWGRGGSGEKLGRGEGEASREEGGTYWRLVGVGISSSSPFVVVRIHVASSSSSIC